MNKTILIHTLGVDLPKTEFRGIYLTQVVLCFKGRKKGRKPIKSLLPNLISHCKPQTRGMNKTDPHSLLRVLQRKHPKHFVLH